MPEQVCIRFYLKSNLLSRTASLAVLYFTVLYCTVLYCTVLYCSVL